MKVRDLIGLTDSEREYYLVYKGQEIRFAYRWDMIIEKKYMDYLNYEVMSITIRYNKYDNPYIAIILK